MTLNNKVGYKNYMHLRVSMPLRHILWVELIFRIIFWVTDYFLGVLKTNRVLFPQRLQGVELKNDGGGMQKAGACWGSREMER